MAIHNVSTALHNNRHDLFEFKNKETPEGPKEGVYLTCQIYKDYEMDDAVWEMIKGDLIKGLSFGGQNHEEEIKFEKGSDPTSILTKLSGFEFSVVPGMGNQEATMDEVNFLAKSNIKKEDGETSQDSAHYHLYRMDEDGEGKTLGTLPRETEEHTHKIVQGVVQVENGHSHRLIRKLVDKEEVTKPFAGFKDFDACVSANQDKDNPSAFCAFLKDRVEKVEEEYKEKTDHSDDKLDKSNVTPRGMTLPSSSEKGGSFIKNDEPVRLMEAKTVKKVDEETSEENNSVEERLARMEQMMNEMMDRLSTAANTENKEGHMDEEEEEEEVTKEGDGEKVTLPKTADEKVQDESPAEGAETDEVKFVEKDVAGLIKKQVAKEVAEIKKALNLTKETTPRMGLEKSLVNKGGSKKMPTTFKEINQLERSMDRKR